MAFKEQVSVGADFEVTLLNRNYGGAETSVFKIDGITGLTRVAALSGAIASTPSVVVSAAAQLGTGPTAKVSGSSLAVEVVLTTGSSTSALVGTTPIIAFTLKVPAGTYSKAPFCSVEPSNAASTLLEAGSLTANTQSALLYYDRTASTATSLVFKLVSNGTPTPAASTALNFQIWING